MTMTEMWAQGDATIRDPVVLVIVLLWTLLVSLITLLHVRISWPTRNNLIGLFILTPLVECFGASMVSSILNSYQAGYLVVITLRPGGDRVDLLVTVLAAPVLGTFTWLLAGKVIRRRTA